MKTVTFTYPVPDADAIMARALSLGYKKEVIDESQLVDGKIPVVQATDDDNNLLFEREYVSIEDEMNGVVGEFKLDEEGNKIPIMVQKNLLIENPETPEEFVAKKARRVVAQFLMVAARNEVLATAKSQAEEIIKQTESTLAETEKAVEESIEVTITDNQ